MLSFTTPVAAGVRSELPEGCDLDSVCTDRTELRVDRKDLEKCGLATRAILATASNGEKDEEERRYVWFQHVPLYYLGLLTRPKHLGSIRGNSEHSDMVSPTCKNPEFFRYASRFSSTCVDDCEIQDKIYKSYSVVSAQKRDVKSDIENCDPQDGLGRKHNRGRMDARLTPAERGKQIELAIDIVGINGILPLMPHGRSAEIKKCWDILLKNRRHYLERTRSTSKPIGSRLSSSE